MLNSKEKIKSENKYQRNLESTNIDQLQNLVLTTDSSSIRQTNIDSKYYFIKISKKYILSYYLF